MLFPSVADKFRGVDALLDHVLLSLGDSSDSSSLASISMAVSSDITACCFPGAIRRKYSAMDGKYYMVIAVLC